MITGLCRGLRNFREGDRFVYVTRICPDVARERGLDSKRDYLGVASMRVSRVEGSHGEAALQFSPRQYVSAPIKTPYPPGLAHDPAPVAAASRECCIVHAKVEGGGRDDVGLTPLESTQEQWRKQYSDYHQRQIDKRLRAAFCEFETVASREALASSLEEAPVFSSADWGNRRMNVMGLLVDDAVGERLAARIANRGALDSLGKL
jgi:hypothetical protein